MNAWKRIILACLSLTIVAAAPVGAAPPRVTVSAATPSSAYQGETLDVAVSGSGFDPSAKVQYFVSGTTNPGGITVRNVKYASSGELVTTIEVSSAADLANFDIVVTLDSGRKGKGITLFKVNAGPKPGDSTPLPTYPDERAWHSFTSNGESDVARSRLYMFGGSNSEWLLTDAYLWFYRAHADAWVLVIPDGTAAPGRLQWAGLSCGAGACVLATGRDVASLLNETWAYAEAINAWTKGACSRKSPCPSPRQMVTMAFDPERRNHLLFGGQAGFTAGHDDTWTFDVATLKWTLRKPTFKPVERNRAAAVHVPGIGVVMHGGQPASGRYAYCDMYAWSGSNWVRIDFDAAKPHPCAHSHSVAWDGTALVLTGGYVDTSDTPSPSDWRFTFAADGRSGSWSQTSRGTCAPVLGTDAEIHPGARMAYDVATATRVYFGGEQNFAGVGVVRYDNTVECYGE